MFKGSKPVEKPIMKSFVKNRLNILKSFQTSVIYENRAFANLVFRVY